MDPITWPDVAMALVIIVGPFVGIAILFWVSGWFSRRR